MFVDSVMRTTFPTKIRIRKQFSVIVDCCGQLSDLEKLVYLQGNVVSPKIESHVLQQLSFSLSFHSSQVNTISLLLFLNIYFK